MLFSVEKGLTHVHFISFLISSGIVLKVNYSCMLCAGIVSGEIIVRLKPQIMSVARGDIRASDLKIEINKTLCSFIHMIYCE